MSSSFFLREYVIRIVIVGIILFLGMGNFCMAKGGYSLFTPSHPCKVGDIVMVIISESSLASQSTKTETGKKVQADGEVSSFPGQALTLPAWGWKHKSDYGGSGSTQHKGTLIAQVSAQIIQVLPNGNFRIRGERKIKVNNEEQIIFVEGIIRPQDINNNNTVYSNQIAEASIRYQGKGPLAEAQRPGIIPRILGWLGIF